MYERGRLVGPTRRIALTEQGPRRNALIGLFKDDDGGRYFMIVNLHRNEHGPRPAAASSRVCDREKPWPANICSISSSVAQVPMPVLRLKRAKHRAGRCFA